MKLSKKLFAVLLAVVLVIACMAASADRRGSAKPASVR